MTPHCPHDEGEPCDCAQLYGDRPRGQPTSLHIDDNGRIIARRNSPSRRATPAKPERDAS